MNKYIPVLARTVFKFELIAPLIIYSVALSCPGPAQPADSPIGMTSGGRVVGGFIKVYWRDVV